MKTAITVILIIVAVAAVYIFFHSLLCFSYVFGIDMDEDGGLHQMYRVSE